MPLAQNQAFFVVADTHGEFEIFVELLRQHGVIDEALRWSYGTGRLALLGDVFDRGPNQTEILWLIYKLESEAARAGGSVHLLLGNHESMVLTGDERYLNPKYRKAAQALGVSSYAQLWDSQSLLGRWLRTKAAVMKVGDFLCLHGGISPDLTEQKLTLATINHSVRDFLSGKPSALATFLVTGRTGPLWYRGYFPDVAQGSGYPLATEEHVAAALAHFDVDQILVGHTVVERVKPLYSGAVIAVQVYPRRDKHTGQLTAEAAIWQQGRWHRAKIDGTRDPL
ncbi:MAG TPA: metallophosphoesterase [Steroidobacteraceae bacterium]